MQSKPQLQANELSIQVEPLSQQNTCRTAIIRDPLFGGSPACLRRSCYSYVMQPSKLNFLSSWTAEVQSCANRVRDLIGDRHWLSDGHHKEYLIRAFLKKHLPSYYLIARGFISPAGNSQLPSREIDILVADPAAAAPWLNEGELIIVPPDGVVAHLHCKTTFGSTELTDALQSVDNAHAVCEESEAFDRIWTAMFFFSKGQTHGAEKYLDAVETAIKSNRKGAHLPGFIVVLDGPLIILDRSGDGGAQLRYFASEPHSFALTLANFFNHLASSRTPRSSDWEGAISTVNRALPVSRITKW